MVENGYRGDVLIQGLCERIMDCILDVSVPYTDAPTYQMKDPSKVLEQAERLKNKKYLQPCLEQHHHSIPFIVSVNGFIREESKMVLKVLAARTSTKTGNTYSNVMGYTRVRPIVAIFKSTHVCLRGSRVPTLRMSNMRPQWEDTTGMALLKF
jgi:hypothetical protein